MVESVTSRRIVDCSLFIITTDSKLAFVWRERQRPNLFGVLELAALVARRGVVPTYAEIKFSRCAYPPRYRRDTGQVRPHQQGPGLQGEEHAQREPLEIL